MHKRGLQARALLSIPETAIRQSHEFLDMLTRNDLTGWRVHIKFFGQTSENIVSNEEDGSGRLDTVSLL
jgi:hypothetical protein